MSFRYQSLWILFILSKHRWISESWPSRRKTRIRPEFQLSGVMNGYSELLHNIRGPTGPAYIEVAFFFLLEGN